MTSGRLAWLNGSLDKPPIFLKLRSSKTFIIITVSTAIFTDIFAYAVIVPVVPFALTSRVGIQPDNIQTWISILLCVYGAALLVTAPFCGWLADRNSSRRMPLLVGLIALAASTVMLCIGNSIGVLVAGRVLQGMSAAVVWVVGLALLVDTVGSEQVGQAMGYVGISMSLAVLLAPLLGGVVFATSGYYAVFAMAFGLIALDIVLRLTMIERKLAAKWLPAEDAIPDGGKNDDTAGVVEGTPQAVDIEMTAAQTTKAAEPVETEPPPQRRKLPAIIRLCASRRLLSALFACLVQSTLLTSFDATLPLFVKDTFGWDSIGAGLIFLPLVVATFLGPIAGTLSDKYGPRWFATIGFIIGCPFLILLRLVDHNSLGQKILLCALLALIGVALTLMLTPILAEMTYIVAEKERTRPPGYFGRNGAYAQSYSLLNVAWAAGLFVGPLLAGLVNESSGWITSTLILGCVSLFAAIPTVIFTGGSLLKKRRQAV
ncbi:hypothetical protein AMS68_003263 [Peltaster fructicola]|uniref:Major facilitator superfamily (MFS) profile domain-containing protein n=1 Tax=Peltaster fructicola TaxID=286661 RepID=A0A6H0XSU3_9PEZI|nr:hypothetical protein AMS68_003263 [Peltaster fructicola]